MPESTIVRPSPAEARRSVIAAWKDPIAADFRLYVRECSNAALYDLAEGLWWAIEHPGTNPETDPALRHLVDRGREENLRLCQAEIDRRRRLVALGRKLPKIFTPRFNRMREVCQQIREEVELEDLVLNAGMPIKLGEKESHAPCLLCGGPPGVARTARWGAGGDHRRAGGRGPALRRLHAHPGMGRGALPPLRQAPSRPGRPRHDRRLSLVPDRLGRVDRRRRQPVLPLRCPPPRRPPPLPDLPGRARPRGPLTPAHHPGRRSNPPPGSLVSGRCFSVPSTLNQPPSTHLPIDPLAAVRVR